MTAAQHSPNPRPEEQKSAEGRAGLVARLISALDGSFPRLCRFTVYLGVLAILLALLPMLAAARGVDAFRENALVENVQVIILFVNGMMLLSYAIIKGRESQLLVLLATCLFIASARELDSFLGKEGWVLSWKGVALLIAVTSAVYLLPRLETLFGQLGRFSKTSAFGLFWAGFAQAVIVAQLLGHGEFLEALMGDDYVRAYKRVVEESGELVGYALLFFAAIETILYIRSRSSLPGGEATSPAAGEADGD